MEETKITPTEHNSQNSDDQDNTIDLSPDFKIVFLHSRKVLPI